MAEPQSPSKLMEMAQLVRERLEFRSEPEPGSLPLSVLFSTCTAEYFSGDREEARESTG